MKSWWSVVLALLGSLIPADLKAQTPPRQHSFDSVAVPLVPVPAIPAAAAPVADLPRPEQLASFDPMSVQLERRDDRWVIVSGGSVLKECGRREEEARLVWRLISQLGLTQHGVVGGMQPIMEYWLVNGQAPLGLPRGVRVLPINLDELRLEQAQGFWVLRESTRVLFNFGSDETEAKQAFGVIRKYGFNRVGVVGQAVPAMLLFVAHPEGSGTRTVGQGKEQGLSRREKPDGSQPVAQASANHPDTPGQTQMPSPPSFYPTPILPPLQSSTQQMGMMIERGRPSRNAAQPTPQAVPEVAALGAGANRSTFDFRQAQVRQENSDWVLAVGSRVIARFGSSEVHARQAQAALMHYRLTEMYQIGSGEPAACYFLSAGQAPRGLMIGCLGESFQPERLTVRQTGEHFWLMQGGHPVLDGGKKLEDAQQLLRVIRQYGFDYVCRIGPTDAQCLMILVKSF